jgi:hypothetical protein
MPVAFAQKTNREDLTTDITDDTDGEGFIRVIRAIRGSMIRMATGGRRSKNDDRTRMQPHQKAITHYGSRIYNQPLNP